MLLHVLNTIPSHCFMVDGTEQFHYIFWVERCAWIHVHTLHGIVRDVQTDSIVVLYSGGRIDHLLDELLLCMPVRQVFNRRYIRK